jgi:hypothetical protein
MPEIRGPELIIAMIFVGLAFDILYVAIWR